jgi:hypothetical protein
MKQSQDAVRLQVFVLAVLNLLVPSTDSNLLFVGLFNNAIQTA